MMKVFENKKDLNITATAATVGFFDGVHCGHRFLFGELQTFARSLGLPSAVVTFTTHPRIVLHSDYQPLLLNTFEEKIDLLSDTGIDYAFVLDFTPELAQFSAEQFIKEILYNQLNIRALLIGHDHRFGHQRREGFDEYVRYGSESGMVIKKATPYSDGEQVVSSSVIRRELEAGNVATAARMLGY
ncbi:MAG: FAD synthetase family protein, partial [Tannerella sp.]|nr:FAD synthetase family protein [Tannerella sp.]